MTRHYLTNTFTLIMAIGLMLACMPSLLRVAGSNISLTYIYILACSILLLFIILKDRTVLSFYHYQARKNRLLFISISTIFLLHLFHVITNPENGIVSRPLISLIIFTTCYLYFSFVFYNDNAFFERFYYGITLGLILNLVAALLQKSGVDLGTSFYDGHDRFTGLFSNPNQLAIVASTTFLFYIDKIDLHQRPLRMLFNIGVVASCFMLLLLAGSKTNIIVSFVILMVFLIVSVTKRTIANFLFGFIVLLASLFLIKESGILMHVNPRLFEILSALSLDTVLEYRTVASRIEMWDYSWNVGFSYPYLGEGVNHALPGRIPHSHNLIIDYLRIFGPAGFVAIVCFMYAVLGYRINSADNALSNQRAKICKYSILAYLLANMMSDSMGPQTVFFLAFFVSYLSVHSSMLHNFTNIKEVTKSEGLTQR